jgi:hypothetical protein
MMTVLARNVNCQKKKFQNPGWRLHRQDRSLTSLIHANISLRVENFLQCRQTDMSIADIGPLPFQRLRVGIRLVELRFSSSAFPPSVLVSDRAEDLSGERCLGGSLGRAVYAM